MSTNEYVNPIEMFRGGIPFEGDIDVPWFTKVPNASVAQDRLAFLQSPSNVAELMRRGYGGDPLNAMWKAVYRACATYGVVVPSSMKGHARELGVELP